MPKRWYVVQSKPNSERTVVSKLQSLGFNTFFPTYLDPVTTHTPIKPGVTKKLVVNHTRALFPTYVFTEFDIYAQPRWREIGRAAGVLQLIGCSDRYVSPLPIGYVEALLAQRDSTGQVQLERACDKMTKFIKDMRLEIQYGAFQGHVGTYCKHSGSRVVLLLALLNQKTRVVLPVDAVLPADT